MAHQAKQKFNKSWTDGQEKAAGNYTSPAEENTKRKRRAAYDARVKAGIEARKARLANKGQ